MLFASLIASQIRGPMRRQSLLKPYCLHAASVVRFALDPNALRFDPANREFFHKHERAGVFAREVRATRNNAYIFG